RVGPKWMRSGGAFGRHASSPSGLAGDSRQELLEVTPQEKAISVHRVAAHGDLVRCGPSAEGVLGHAQDAGSFRHLRVFIESVHRAGALRLIQKMYKFTKLCGWGEAWQQGIARKWRDQARHPSCHTSRAPADARPDCHARRAALGSPWQAVSLEQAG